MKTNLAIVGQGAVTPAGIGFESLVGREPVISKAASLRMPEKVWSVLRVNQKAPELLRWQFEPRLRRSSPLTFFLIEAAAQALAGLNEYERAQTGLIIAYSAGCLIYSRRFFEGILRDGPALASPALFPETVFNSPGSHVASVFKLNGAAYALVGDETAMIAALKTASTWLQRKRVERVLILGADEFDPLALDAYQCSRWLKHRGSSPGFLPSEGAGALLVRPAVGGDEKIITEMDDGFIYRNAGEAATAASRVRVKIEVSLPTFPTAGGTWLADLEKKFNGHQPTVRSPGPHLGEAFTASATWNILRATSMLSCKNPALALPLWGLNHQLGWLKLEHRT